MKITYAICDCVKMVEIPKARLPYHDNQSIISLLVCRLLIFSHIQSNSPRRHERALLANTLSAELLDNDVESLVVTASNTTAFRGRLSGLVLQGALSDGDNGTSTTFGGRNVVENPVADKSYRSLCTTAISTYNSPSSPARYAAATKTHSPLYSGRTFVDEIDFKPTLQCRCRQTTILSRIPRGGHTRQNFE